MPSTDGLIAGYKRFRDGYYQTNKEHLSRLASEGQSPTVALISCCDSRVDPSIILDCSPGDLFVIRNVANLVPPCESSDGHHGTSAALEFAVKVLKVESVIVLGHSRCGGIKALMDSHINPSEPSFISQWMMQLNYLRAEILQSSDQHISTENYRHCEQKAIVHSLTNLKSFSWINSAVNRGDLLLHGWYYDLEIAELFAYKQEIDSFQKIS